MSRRNDIGIDLLRFCAFADSASYSYVTLSRA